MAVFFSIKPDTLTHVWWSLVGWFSSLYRMRWKMLSTNNLLPEIFYEDALLNLVPISFKNCYFTYDFCPFFKYVHIHLQVQFLSINHNTVFCVYINIYCLQRSRFYIYLIFKQHRLISVAAVCIGSWNAVIINWNEQRIAKVKIGRFWYYWNVTMVWTQCSNIPVWGTYESLN